MNGNLFAVIMATILISVLHYPPMLGVRLLQLLLNIEHHDDNVLFSLSCAGWQLYSIQYSVWYQVRTTYFKKLQ